MSMSDCELLVAAAKASGVLLRFLNGTMPFSDGPDRVGVWDPLTDDGDALRLAVKLRLQITVAWDTPTEVQVTYIKIQEDGSWTYHDVLEDGEDTDAITRRAIVRAAAEMEHT